MKQLEQDIHRYIHTSIEEPSAVLKQRILTDASVTNTPNIKHRRPLGKPAFIAILAGLLVLCSMSVALAYREQIKKYVIFLLSGAQESVEEHPFSTATIEPGNNHSFYGDFLDNQIQPGELRRVTHEDGIGARVPEISIYNYEELVQRARIAGLLLPDYCPDGYTFDYGYIGPYIREGSPLELTYSRQDEKALFEIFSLSQGYENDIHYFGMFFKNEDDEYLSVSIARVKSKDDIEIIYNTDTGATSEGVSMDGFANGILVSSIREGLNRFDGTLVRDIPPITALSIAINDQTFQFTAEVYTVLCESLPKQEVLNVLTSFK